MSETNTVWTLRRSGDGIARLPQSVRFMRNK